MKVLGFMNMFMLLVSGAGIFAIIMKGTTSTFVKETAKKVGAKALEAAADKVGSHVGEYAVKKTISAIYFSSGSGKTNALVHMLLKPLIYYDKVYRYTKSIDQEKYQLLSNELNKVAKKNKFSVN